MISAIGSIGSTNSSYAISAQQNLTLQTKSQLESLGIDTANITTEAQGQAALKASQSSQQTQGTQQTQHAGGGNSAMKSLKEEAVALAQRLGVSVSSNEKLDEILDAIAQALSQMQAQAANNPQKAAQVAQYQAEYQSLCQSVSNIQSSMEASKAQSGASQIQSSMNALAVYNMASISVANSGKIKS
jgi:hypothetical protein